MPKSIHCGIQQCGKPAIATLDSSSMCQGHFIAFCRARLQNYMKQLSENSLGKIPAESVRHFIHECMWQADQIERSSRDLDDAARAQLADIILTAAELGCHLRRSPRRAANIPLRVCCEQSEKPWEEETKTRLISRYGALVDVQHAIEVDERVRVIRSDNGRQAAARVAWHRHNASEQQEVGIEFVDCDNFWGLDWGLIETET